MSIEDQVNLQQLYAASELVAEHYDNDTYFYSGPLNSVGFANIIAAVLERENRSNCLLILNTIGGSSDIAYQIARFLHGKYSKLYLCAPGFCKSAGTLVALGAHTILADEYTEFGPINGNVHVSNGNGVLDSEHLATLEFELNYSLESFEKILLRLRYLAGSNIRADIAAELSLIFACKLVNPRLSQVNLVKACRELRHRSVILAYGQRLASHSRNMREGAVEKLVKGYPSHEFIIDFSEAEQLFASIEKPVVALYDLLGCLGDPVYSQQQLTLVRRIQRPRSHGPGNGVGSESPVGSTQRSARRPRKSKPGASGQVRAAEQPRRKVSKKKSELNTDPGAICSPCGAARR
ncbi:MAG: SDH family Clp fold serine proteinase [Hyphomicrobiaceae bacterium]